MRLNRQALKASARVVAVYAVFGVAWILLSDAAILRISSDPAWLVWAQRFKGLGYIGITSAMLLGLMVHSHRRLLEAGSHVAEREARIHDLFEASSVPMLVGTPEGLMLEVNDAFCALVGYPRDELLGRVVGTLTHPDDVARDNAETQEILDNKGRCVRQKRYVRRDGGSVHVRIQTIVTRDADGRAKRVLGVIEDVSELVAHDASRRQSEQRLRLALAAANQGTFEYRRDRDGMDFDDNSRTILGLPAQRAFMTSDEITALVHPDDRPARARVLQRLHDNHDELMAIEFRWRHEARGQWLWLRVRGRVTERDAEGRGLRLLGVIQEITAERELRDTQARDLERLRVAAKARDAAEAASRAKSDFLSRMSHELRTPLNGVIGFAQLLQRAEGDPLTGRQRAALQTIEASSRHLLAMIEDVLDTAQIEAGTVRLAPERVDLATLVHEAVELVRPEAERAGVALAVEIAAGPALAMADRVRACQVLVNLLDNAVKYNRPGGHAQVVLGLRDGWATVVVRDDGIGMSAAQRAHLFEPFNRLGRETSGTPGTGMGLVIAKGLLQAMGATLDVHSEAGAGSEFGFALPRVAEPAAPPPALPAAAPTARYGPKRVVYAEDNPVNAELLRAVLALRPQIDTVIVGSVAECLADLGAHGADLLLLDMHLPDGTGLDALRALRQAPRTAGLPVVIVSADAMAERVSDAVAAGAQAYITKPLDVAGTLALVDRVLGG